MSLTQRFIELQEDREAFIRVLEIILETEQLDHEVSIGIAKKIIADGNIKKLSDKQLSVFNNHIEPFFKVHCKHCSSSLGILSLPEAYENQYEFSGLLCVDCALDMGRQNI